MPDEVEEFLRRVAQMRAQAEAQARAQQQRPKPQAAPPPPLAPPPPARLVPARQEIVHEPVEADVVDAELADTADRVSRQVTRDMRGTEEIAEHSRRLGEEVDQADDKLEARLHQVFDHQLGRLKTTASSTAAAPHTTTPVDVTLNELYDLLRSPSSIRDAIVMAEVLKRPEERW